MAAGVSSGRALKLQTSKISKRKPFSEEINKEYGEGGAPNAGYQTLEAVAVAANALGANGLKHGEDFFLKTVGLDEIVFDFASPEARERAKVILAPYIFQEEPETAEEKHVVLCSLCNEPMRLVANDFTSGWQCEKDPTHYMRMTEWSDFIHGKRKLEQVIAVMKERQVILQQQRK